MKIISLFTLILLPHLGLTQNIVGYKWQYRDTIEKVITLTAISKLQYPQVAIMDGYEIRDVYQTRKVYSKDSSSSFCHVHYKHIAYLNNLKELFSMENYKVTGTQNKIILVDRDSYQIR